MVALTGDKAVQQLVDDVGRVISALFKVSEGIAMLDMVCRFLCTLTRAGR